MKKGVAALYVAALVGLALIGSPLGHDEAQYALGGARLLGHDVSAFPLHRPIGMQLLAAPGVWAGGGELAFRLVAIASTLAFLGAAWWYARRVHGAQVARWTLAVIATSFAILRRSAELLPDAPAAALVLVFAAVLVGGLSASSDPARRWRLAWLGPIAAAAFYLRYGSISILGALSLSAAIVWRAQLRANLGPLLAAIALAALGAIPHVLLSLDATGSALGVLRLARFAAGRAYTGEGLVFYATWWWLWMGPLAAVCVAVGLGAGGARRDPRATFAALGALIALVALGLDAHGEARFVIVLEVVLAAAGVDAIIARVRPMPRLATAALRLCLVGSVAAAGVGVSRAGRTFEVAVRAGTEIRRAADGARCRVLSGQWTQLEWYSGCAGIVIPDAITADGLAGASTFLVWFDDGRRQPPSALAGVRQHRSGVRAEKIAHVADDDGYWGGADVYRLEALTGSATR